ncbi:MAG TPA: FHA domain-containing protein [Tepidisphaeraceae bacterium]|nr:FHA domain-containing protein [Tepidisphaeraceae bacterium]
MVKQKSNAHRGTQPSAVLVRMGEGPAGQKVRLDRSLTIVGSKPHAHLRIISPDISGSHALLLNIGNNVFVRDLLSRTGVFVNDQPVGESRLKFGDVIRFGGVNFRFDDSNLLRQSPGELRAKPGQLRLDGGQAVDLGAMMFVIGRKTGCDLVLNSDAVSKTHAVLFEKDGQRVLRDLDSRHGTFVNGTRVRNAVLKSGDVIRIGDADLRYVLLDDAAATPPVNRLVAAAAHLPPENGNGAHVSVGPDIQDNSQPEDADHVFVSDPVVVPAPAEFQGGARSSGAHEPEVLQGSDDHSDADNASEWVLDVNAGGDSEAETRPNDHRHIEEAHDLLDWGVAAAEAPISNSPSPPASPRRQSPPILSQTGLQFSPAIAALDELLVADQAPAPGESGGVSRGALTPGVRSFERHDAVAGTGVAGFVERESVGNSDTTFSELVAEGPDLLEDVASNTTSPIPGVASAVAAGRAVAASPGPRLAREDAIAQVSAAGNHTADNLAEIVGTETLSLYADGSPGTLGYEPTARIRSRGKWIWAVAAIVMLAVVAALGGAGWWYLHRH